ncbi:hypothetical protein ACTMU2_00880 [Cupriavidus basilensis]
MVIERNTDRSIGISWKTVRQRLRGHSGVRGLGHADWEHYRLENYARSTLSCATPISIFAELRRRSSTGVTGTATAQTTPSTCMPGAGADARAGNRPVRYVLELCPLHYLARCASGAGLQLA